MTGFSSLNEIEGFSFRFADFSSSATLFWLREHGECPASSNKTGFLGFLVIVGREVKEHGGATYHAPTNSS